MSKVVMIVGIILLLLGIFYVAAPHSMHVSTGLGFSMEHSTHQILGVILFVVGIVILWKGRK
ncbi:MAG: hypothetical protein WC613_03235 [Candidatus Aenigmatarchaeota archaeon]